MIGLRWSRESHAVRDFLARNQIPCQWLDLELRREECEQLMEIAKAGAQSLPLLLFPNGKYFAHATVLELADWLGLKRHADRPSYDLAIIWGGPAGLGAAVNASSEGLKTLRVEREAPAGQAGTSSRIENYMDFAAGLSGAGLARRAVAQARRCGTEILTPQEVVKLRAQDNYRILTLADGSEVSARAVMIATGVQWRRLTLEGIEKLHGAGVYYGVSVSGATAGADEDIYTVGGANSAGQAAVHFCRYAALVTMLVRADSLTKPMSQYLIEQIANTPKSKFRCARTSRPFTGTPGWKPSRFAISAPGRKRGCRVHRCSFSSGPSRIQTGSMGPSHAT